MSSQDSSLPTVVDWQQKLEVCNAQWNDRIPYRSQSFQEKWTYEDFTESDGYLDCKGYAITKMEDLQKQGFPAERLHLATCWVPGVTTPDYTKEDIAVTRFSNHMILIAELDQGDYALDNRNQKVVPVIATGYFLVAMETAGIWNLIEESK